MEKISREELKKIKNQAMILEEIQDLNVPYYAQKLRKKIQI
jgi:hypothetical protein